MLMCTICLFSSELNISMSWFPPSVLATCGQTTQENCTYFVSPSYPSQYDGTGSCQLTVHKTHPDVCQFRCVQLLRLFLQVRKLLSCVTLWMLFRLDFDQFTMAGPEQVNQICNYDQFIVSGGSPVNAICGQNSGNHSKFFKLLMNVKSFFNICFCKVSQMSALRLLRVKCVTLQQ